MNNHPDILVLDHISLIQYFNEKCEKKHLDLYNNSLLLYNTMKRINNRKNKIKNVIRN